MSLRVIVAPDSFKGSLPAHSVAQAIAQGWSSERPDDEVLLIPQADGGEGTLDAIEAAVPGSRRRTVPRCTGPDQQPTSAEWLQLPDGTAVIELAQSSGLPLMADLDALGATTRGLGEVIDAALEAGARALVIGLGGSASTDGGSGALSALGLRLLDSAGGELADGGGALAELRSVDAAALKAAPAGGVVLITDVTAPLLGPLGAAAVFGPQKGATSAQVEQLDAALGRFAAVLGGDSTFAGAGAAGGSAFGFVSAWGADVRAGADYVAELSGFAELVAGADVVLTGEGRFDSQSMGGKVVGALVARAAQSEASVGIIAGQVDVAPPGIWTTSLVGLAGSVDAAMGDPERWLIEAGRLAAAEMTASRR